LGEVCENIRDFTVLEDSNRVIGCGALHFYGSDLAEIRSLAIDAAAQGRGGGSRLVRALLAEARAHGVACVCLFTHIPDYFAAQGFVAVEHRLLPEKIWRDCLRCPQFDRCGETAMVFGGLAGRLDSRTTLPALASRLPG
jgi:amino-acid N-acetyltransferase